MLSEIAELMETTKAAILKDILDDSIPEIHAMVKNAERLKEEGRIEEVIPNAAASGLRKIATFFDSMFEESNEKK